MRDFAAHSRWLPWPEGTAPDLRLAQALGETTQVVALLGHAAAGLRGRFGVVGIPGRVQVLPQSDAALVDLVAGRPKDTLRVALLGYEMGLPVLRLPPAPPPSGQPYGLCADLAAYLVVDHRDHLFAWGGPDRCALELLKDALTSAPLLQPENAPISFVPSVSDAEHARRVRRVQEAIAAGDIYQANVTRQMHVHGNLYAATVLGALARHNPVAHTAWVRLANTEVVSNTMETLLHYDARARVAQSFPIKGTCAEAQYQAATTLRADPKEQAEHVMIVDLVRNDLGQLATPGSVEVPILMGIEPYRGVWHGVSTVRAHLAAGCHAGHALRALYPGGSIVGAPKRRAVSILQEIEQSPRGFYTGALGLIAPNGDAHFSLLIRTLVRDGAGWHLGVGGGIVADSVAAREIAEMGEKIVVFEEVLSARR